MATVIGANEPFPLTEVREITRFSILGQAVAKSGKFLLDKLFHPASERNLRFGATFSWERFKLEMKKEYVNNTSSVFLEQECNWKGLILQSNC